MDLLYIRPGRRTNHVPLIIFVCNTLNIAQVLHTLLTKRGQQSLQRLLTLADDDDIRAMA